ncbi:MAG: Rne/Rng family ribonuclease [Flavobacteriales bacterium]|nr:Rne/Rng family ribonuclease [Flavobacteriales bacterium]
MSSVLYIDAKDSGVDIALIEDKQLVELHHEDEDSSFSVGDIYLGKVHRITPGLNAAFVNIGSEKDAFLHYHDLGPQIRSMQKFTKLTLSKKLNRPWLKDFKREPEINKNGVINDVLSANENILVQVVKEPISTKGPRISSEITIPGRYIVLIPFSDKISISQRIRSREEKDRLARLLNSIKPNGFGLIVRTAAEDKKVAELDSDLKNLLVKWEAVYKGLINAKPKKKILGEENKTKTYLRDMVGEGFSNIIINDTIMATQVRDYLKRIAPEREKIVKEYNGKIPIFERYGVEKQIKSAFGKNVTLNSGAYLVIEHTEALHVIDVNSGNTAKADKDQETNALVTNIEAAKEVARQLRLRDIGGIIVVDFIDMRSNENKRALFEALKNEMKNDKAKHVILPLSKFCLAQITRQRVRPQVTIKTKEVCPSCLGSGEVEATVLLIEQIEREIRDVFKKSDHKKMTVCVHPFVAAYLNKGLPSLRFKWSMDMKRKIRIRSLDALQLLEYYFLDANENAISDDE